MIFSRLHISFAIALCAAASACSGGLATLPAPAPSPSVDTALATRPPREAVQMTVASVFAVVPAIPSVRYQPLNIPRASITLPALLVGAEQQLSTGCFQPLALSQPTPVLADFAQTITRETDFSGELKAQFKNALIEAGLAADVASLLMQRWTVRFAGLQLAEIDPASIRPNFDNQACTAVGADWFNNDRTVLSGAIKADSFSVIVGNVSDQSRSVGVNAAIQKLKTNFNLDLASSALAADSVSYTGRGVFIGALRTQLRATRCPSDLNVVLVEGQPAVISACNGEVRITLTYSGAGQPFDVQVAIPQDGVATDQFEVARNTAFREPLGQLRLVTGFLQTSPAPPFGERITLTINVLQVLSSGAP